MAFRGFLKEKFGKKKDEATTPTASTPTNKPAASVSARLPDESKQLPKPQARI